MKIGYKFKFESGRSEVFDLEFDDQSFAIRPNPISTVSTSESWMELEHHQCPDCTLSKYQYPICPVAANLGCVVDPFQQDASYTPVTTEVDFRERKVVKKSDLQGGLSSMIGLVMATSGCPVLDKLRPMAYTHQPFSNIDETIYRAIAGYLLAQYVRQEEQREALFKAEGLVEIYTKIGRLNNAFSKRLRGFKDDANINALVILDLFAKMGELYLNDEWRKQMLPLFEVYLNEQKPLFGGLS